MVQSKIFLVKFYFNGQSAAVAHTCTLCGIGTQNDVPETYFLTDLTSNKIKVGGGRHIEIRFNGYNSTVIPCLHSKFDSETEIVARP